MKMHAYRDAIRRSAGAYVLYPGRDDGKSPQYPLYHEILPGLGAFLLRPTDTGTTAADSEHALRAFLEAVISHLAAQGTGLERSRYWTDQSYAGAPPTPIDYSEILTKPPADTQVLLGVLKSPEHREWVMKVERYNLRADGRRGSVGVSSSEVDADFVVLYEAQSDDMLIARVTRTLFLNTREELIEQGYPNPRGDRYVCLELRGVAEFAGVEAHRVRSLARGAPVPIAVRWAEMLGE